MPQRGKEWKKAGLGIPFPERSRALTPGKCPLVRANSCFGCILWVPLWRVVRRIRRYLSWRGSPIYSVLHTLPEHLLCARLHAKWTEAPDSSSENQTKNKEQTWGIIIKITIADISWAFIKEWVFYKLDLPRRLVLLRKAGPEVLRNLSKVTQKEEWRTLA